MCMEIQLLMCKPPVATKLEDFRPKKMLMTPRASALMKKMKMLALVSTLHQLAQSSMCPSP